MRKPLLFLLPPVLYLLVTAAPAHAQSLQKNDTAAINRLTSRAAAYEYDKSDSLFYFSNQALQQASALGYSRGMVNAYLLLGMHANIYLDSAALALHYYKRAQEVLEPLLRTTPENEQVQLKEKLAQALKGQGLVYEQMGNYPLALEAQFRSLQYAQEVKNKSISGKAMHNIAMLYQCLGNYPTALEWGFKSMALKEQLPDKNGLALTENLIGSIYGGAGDYKKALTYCLLALQRIEKLEKGDKNLIAKLYINIAIIHSANQHYKEALAYFSKALALIERHDIKSSLSGCYNNMGNCYMAQGNYTLALDYFLKGLQSSHAKEALAISQRNIGDAYFAQKNYGQALSYANKALDLAKQLGALSHIKVAEELLSRIYEKRGEQELALQHYKAFKQANDSLYNVETAAKMLRTEMNNEFERRQLLEKTKQAQAMALSAQEISRQKLMRNGLSIMLALLLISTAAIIFNYRNKLRSNKLLALKTEELHQQQTLDLLKQQQLKSMQNLVSGQEMERNRVARELHDGVGGSLAGIKFKLQNLGTTLQNGKQELDGLVMNIDSLYREVRAISHNLAPPQLNNSVFTQVISQLLDELETNSPLRISLEYLEEEKLNLLPEPVQVAVYRILQELLKNSLQHARCTYVEVGISKYEHELNVLVEDNGVGFNPAKKAQGLGLRNIQERVKALGGVLTIDSQAGRGTAFTIAIPC